MKNDPIKTAAETAALTARLYRNESSDRQTKPDAEPSAEARAELVSVTLWQRLGEMFGSGFYSQYGDVDGSGRQTWKRALAQYSDAQIKRGLEHCLEWTGRFPPNLAQFSRLCLTERIGYHQPANLKRLEVKRASASVKERELERQRRIASSPKGRVPTGGDVESFEDSYHGLNLGQRWPGKPVTA